MTPQDAANRIAATISRELDAIGAEAADGVKPPPALLIYSLAGVAGKLIAAAPEARRRRIASNAIAVLAAAAAVEAQEVDAIRDIIRALAKHGAKHEIH